MPLDQRLYLDHVAGSPLTAAARAAFEAHLDANLGNPSSPHQEGQQAKASLEAARDRIARTWECAPREIIFTGSGTEAAVLALLGAARARRDVSRRVVMSAIEHPAIAACADPLADEGFEVITVPVGASGRADAEAVVDAAAGAGVVALMLANHETGVCQPVRRVAAALEELGVPLVCDAALGPGRLAAGPGDVGAPLISFSAHKFGGPRGMGLLYVRRGTALAPSAWGGLQEERIRPGTENAPAAAATAAALEEVVAATPTRARTYDAWVARVLAGLTDAAGWRSVGDDTYRLPGVLTLELDDVDGEAVMMNLDLEGVAVATGSTCALGSRDPSPSLLAMGFATDRAARTIRMSVGGDVLVSSADTVSSTIKRTLERLRTLAGT